VIFDTTERLCGELGLEAVSVRDIAAAAQVNLGAINYYFGSRMNLLVEILRVRGAELAVERERLLAQVRTEETPSVRAILHAVMAPLAQWRRKGSNRRAALMYLSRALIAAQPEFKREVDSGVLAFRSCIDLLQRALPQLSRAELCWRFHFTMSIEHMNAWDEERLHILSNGLCKTDDQDETLERALDFAVAGFMAAAHGAEGARRR
jgi:AcrR family transcriptional regulator